MKDGNRLIIEKSIIENAIDKTSTMGGAAKFLKLDWRTFKKIAIGYSVYKPTGGNQYRKRFELRDILDGKHPQYNTSHLSKRLVKEGYKEYKCEGKDCGISEWKGERIGLELNHIDGDNSNHSLENLELLCPNCHSQTPTYRSKKIKLKNGELAESGLMRRS